MRIVAVHKQHYGRFEKLAMQVPVIRPEIQRIVSELFIA